MKGGWRLGVLCKVQQGVFRVAYRKVGVSEVGWSLSKTQNYVEGYSFFKQINQTKQ